MVKFIYFYRKNTNANTDTNTKQSHTKQNTGLKITVFPLICDVSLCGFEPQLTNLEFIVYPPKLKNLAVFKGVLL